jgi:hypothetical protein
MLSIDNVVHLQTLLTMYNPDRIKYITDLHHYRINTYLHTSRTTAKSETGLYTKIYLASALYTQKRRKQYPPVNHHGILITLHISLLNNINSLILSRSSSVPSFHIAFQQVGKSTPVIAPSP